MFLLRIDERQFFMVAVAYVLVFISASGPMTGRAGNTFRPDRTMLFWHSDPSPALAGMAGISGPLFVRLTLLAHIILSLLTLNQI